MAITPEGRVKAYLKKRVEALGGETRSVKWIGRRFAPDLRLMFGPLSFLYGRNCYVETKARGSGGRLSSGQEREIERMRHMGETVHVLLSTEDIDRRFPL